MKKLLPMLIASLLFSCNKQNEKNVEAKQIAQEFTNAGKTHNQLLYLLMSKMKNTGKFIELGNINDEMAGLVLTSKTPIIPDFSISDMAWYSQSTDFGERENQLTRFTNTLPSRDITFVNKLKPALSSSFTDKISLKEKLLSLQSELDASALASDEKEKYKGVISVAYYSSLFWTEFYKNTSSSKSNVANLTWPPLVDVLASDAFGYLAGYNLVAPIEAHCADDPACSQAHTNQLNCMALSNGSIWSATYATPNFPSVAIWISCNN